MSIVFFSIVVWIAAWTLNVKLANGTSSGTRLVKVIVPTLFGLTLLLVWEMLVRGLNVPLVILPPPSLVVDTMADNLAILWKDFLQTFLKGALRGYLIGCSAAILTAFLVDRFDFLSRGLLPVGNFIAALPIIGTAPILVMWFGFDWQSKAAVVVVMVFFPMLVNTVAGSRETTQSLSCMRPPCRTASSWSSAGRYPLRCCGMGRDSWPADRGQSLPNPHLRPSRLSNQSCAD